jgi:hypothetical protein
VRMMMKIVTQILIPLVNNTKRKPNNNQLNE